MSPLGYSSACRPRKPVLFKKICLYGKHEDAEVERTVLGSTTCPSPPAADRYAVILKQLPDSIAFHS